MFLFREAAAEVEAVVGNEDGGHGGRIDGIAPRKTRGAGIDASGGAYADLCTGSATATLKGTRKGTRNGFQTNLPRFRSASNARSEGVSTALPGALRPGIHSVLAGISIGRGAGAG